ncbi:MAG: plasminogen-binding N-terminal domain-containing protein [Campylobacterota bacterium]
MNRLLKKMKIAATVVSLSMLFANAQTTICVKDKWNTPSTIETTKLDGGLCAGEYSIKDMREKGWRVVDIKIDTNQNSFSYRYLLTNEDIKQEMKKVNKSTNTKELSFKALGFKIDNLNGNKTQLDVGNLIVGQTGVVIHIIDKNKRLIVANAQVVSSNSEKSIIKFSDFGDLGQDAIPTSNRKVEKGDIIALNYMYKSSLLIAPNQEAFKIVRNVFKYNNFLHSDLFAAQLKINSKALPTKESIQTFTKKQNIRTVFVVLKNKVYVLDAKNLNVLTSYNIDFNYSNSQMPFYTRVEDIKGSSFDFDLSLDNFKEYLSAFDFLFDKEENSKTETTKPDKSNYYDYYRALIGI